MPLNFIAVDWDRSFLMAPSLRGWLAEDHWAWTVLAAVAGMDLSAFCGSYRPDGHGRPAYEPSMMIAVLLCAYARGNRSSRGIERECGESVAYRVLAANLRPDRSTIAEFRCRHETALAGLFSDVLSLCREAGLVKVGVIAIDGTKVHANASNHANCDYEQIAKEILEEAAAVDAAEDELYGDKRGDELPEQLTTEHGRRAWFREAKRRLDEQREQEGRPIAQSRPKRLKESKRRLEEELWAESRANTAYEAWRARGVMSNGRKLNTPAKPYVVPQTPAGKVNVTDLDSRNLKAFRGYV